MFWKKKSPVSDALSYDTDNLRNAYRYHFQQGRGFKIEFKKKQVTVLNINAGGLAFYNQNFAQFDSDFIQFALDIPNFKGDSLFFARLRILKIDQNDICHCVFEQCSLEQHELIHKYVLEMQKNDLAH